MAINNDISDDTLDGLEMINNQSVPIQGKLKGFTPIIDSIAEKHGLFTAAVFGKMWRYCQMNDRVCRAALTTIADGLGMDRSTVQRHVNILCENGYLKDKTPTLRHRPHIYQDTGKAKIVIGIGVAETSTDEKSVAENPTCVAENPLKIDSKKDLKPKTRKDRPRNPTFDAIASVCSPSDPTLREEYLKANGSWIAKVSNNGASHFPPEKIAEWFSEGGWWYAVHCKGMTEIPKPNPTTIQKYIALAAEWDKTHKVVQQHAIKYI